MLQYIGICNKIEEEVIFLEVLFSLLLYIIHIILPFIAIVFIYQCFKSLMINIRQDSPLIILMDKNTKQKFYIMHWENSIGRGRNSDIRLDSLTVSRNHAVLFRREEGWFVSDTNSKFGVKVNGVQIDAKEKVYIDDVINIGGIDLILKKFEDTAKKQPKSQVVIPNKAISQWGLLLFVMVFHLLASIEACFSKDGFNWAPALAFCIITSISWIYFFITKYGFKRVSFELETIAIFLSGIGIITISSVSIGESYTQMTAMAIGIVLFCIIIRFIKNADVAMKFRPYIAVMAMLLFILNITFGKIKNGSQNWILLGPMSVQPSELIKVAFIFVGTSTLERLQTAKNLTGFILFSALCMGSLFIMGDFGTACIFFVTFLIIAFMRSGSLRTIALVCSAAAIGGLMIVKFKPYIIDRFAVWRHVWEHMNDMGYQQTRVLTYSASGGFFGMGIGKGSLKYVYASVTDLVFGMLCEEWGLILAIVSAISVALIAVYARSASIRSRSAFYSIASCSAGCLLVFQMSLNIFGATDILPLTGVTFPFISLGGSSMVCVWGLLAFIKASDERTYAVRR